MGYYGRRVPVVGLVQGHLYRVVTTTVHAFTFTFRCVAFRTQANTGLVALQSYVDMHVIVRHERLPLQASNKPTAAKLERYL